MDVYIFISKNLGYIQYFILNLCRNIIEMTEEIEKILHQTEEQMKKAIGHLELEILKVRAGKASPQMLDGIMVEYYGAPTPISQVANISIVDARTITIQPWEKNMLAPIDRAILGANIGLTPQNDGVMIKLYLPPLTEERRREFVKKVMSEGEHAKVAIRNIRRDHMEAIKKLQKDGMSEDLAKDAEGKIQAMTDKKITETDYHCSIKEKELMTV